MGSGYQTDAAALPEDRGGPLQGFLHGSNTSVSAAVNLSRGNVDIVAASRPAGICVKECRLDVTKAGTKPVAGGLGSGVIRNRKGELRLGKGREMARRVSGFLTWMAVSLRRSTSGEQVRRQGWVNVTC